MTATVLGKRTRSARTAPFGRRVALNELNDENQNPFIGHDRDINNDESADVEDVPLPANKRARSSPRDVQNRVALSPKKISSHFAASKPTVQHLSEEKENLSTPHAPRHRDALLKKVPSTPRHRVLVAGTRQTPKTPRTPTTPSNGSTAVYNRARQLFSRCSAPGRLIGRDGERVELVDFLQRCTKSKAAGCLYVSGPPGTGKSALVDEVVQGHSHQDDLAVSVVNCMSIRNANDLSNKLSEDLEWVGDTGPKQLKSRFVSSNSMEARSYLVVLDEVDRLVDLDLGLLYNLFEWSLHPGSKLTLIGIANALDLTDRFLPRLKSRGLQPELLPFMPYSARQIANVITSRLKTLDPAEQQNVPFLHPAAIQFCAKKVASQTGDLRKAFDICRRAIDLVEQETRARDTEAALQTSPTKTPLMEKINLSSPPAPRSPLASNASPSMLVYTLETAPKATIAHMAKITSIVFGNGTTQRLSTLNLQQKAVLCSLAALEKRKREQQLEKTMFATPSKRGTGAAPSIKELFDAYSKLCKQEKLLAALSNIEFRDVVSGLEALSLVSPVDGRTGGMVLPVTPSKTPSRRGRGGPGFGSAAVNVEEKRLASVIGMKELKNAISSAAGGELLMDILESDGLF